MVEGKTNLSVSFDKRKLGDKIIHFLKIGDRKDLPLIVYVHGSPGALNVYEDYFSDPTLLQKWI